ncbi:MAG: ATP-binding cassette domain-containing protein, partial [Firmicutes bacterium]|nr:ATP-binding cassette domain-containing protein [Bacillota bacterium]
MRVRRNTGAPAGAAGAPPAPEHGQVHLPDGRVRAAGGQVSPVDLQVPALEATGLRKRYGGRLVLSVDSFSVREGEVLAILGPNGAGKSTFFRLLALLEPPDAGEVRYFG